MRPFLFAILFFASAAQAQRAPARVPYTVTATTAAAFAQVRARPASARVTANQQGFTRSGNTLVLHLTSGRRVQLQRKPSSRYEEDVAELSYIGTLPSLHKYVLHLLDYENAATLLVDQTTGAIDTLQGPPIPSPQAGFVGATFQGYPYDGAPNGVEVFQVTAPHLRHLFTIAQQKWVPYELAWVNERSFILKCLPMAVEEAIESGKLPKKTLQSSTSFLYLRVAMR